MTNIHPNYNPDDIENYMDRVTNGKHILEVCEFCGTPEEGVEKILGIEPLPKGLTTEDILNYISDEWDEDE